MRRRRMGRPGLVGTMARTAVVAGTASAVAGGVAHHQNQKYANQAEQDAAEQQAAAQQQQWEQQQQWAAQQQAAAPPPATGVTEDSIAKLKELAALKEQGILTDAEFEVQKAKILNA
jgi:hypothetical protein